LTEKLNAAIATLTKWEQTVIRHRYYENQSARAIAKIYGVSHQAIDKTIDSAKKKIRKFFEEN
jgi:RNA polymerase sigma factor (sigma-70 family)